MIRYECPICGHRWTRGDKDATYIVAAYCSDDCERADQEAMMPEAVMRTTHAREQAEVRDE